MDEEEKEKVGRVSNKLGKGRKYKVFSPVNQSKQDHDNSVFNNSVFEIVFFQIIKKSFFCQIIF